MVIVCIYLRTSNEWSLANVISTVPCYFTDMSRACVTVVEYFGRIQYPFDLYGTVKPGACSSVDQHGSGMLNGFKINHNPSQ